MIAVEYAAPALPAAGALALPVLEGASPSGLWQAAEEATAGALSRALAAAEFVGRRGQTCTILAPGAGLSRVVAVGLGPRDELTRHRLEEAGGTLAAALSREATVALLADALPAPEAAALAQGARLRAWRFDRYRTKQKPEDRPRLARLVVLTPDAEAARAADAPLSAIARGVFLTRELVSEPPNVLTPTEMARRLEALTELGLEVEVLGPERLRAERFEAVLAVAAGSAQEPRVAVLRWNGLPDATGADARPLAFVGKGVTFDTGGISIKPAGGMEDMKWDMAGAGTVAGLMAALAGRRARVNAVGIVGLVENMPIGTAMRPGDVIGSRSGQTIEVINTDAEGRLVLADLLDYVAEKHDPRFMVDLATLTGAMVVALGAEHAGLFCNEETLCARLLAAGTATGEKLWRMPLHENYDRAIRSDIADMKNIGGRQGGGVIAAHFVQRFVANGRAWAHLDIAGQAWSGKDAPCVPKGATAFGVRLLDRMVAEHYEA